MPICDSFPLIGSPMWWNLEKPATWWKFDCIFSILIPFNNIKSTLSRTSHFFLYGINIQSYRLLKLIKNKTLTFWFLQNFHVRHVLGYSRSHHLLCTILTESLWHWFKHAEYLRIWTSVFEVWVYIAWMHWKYTYAWAFESTSESIHVHYLCTKKISRRVTIVEPLYMTLSSSSHISAELICLSIYALRSDKLYFSSGPRVDERSFE